MAFKFIDLINKLVGFAGQFGPMISLLIAQLGPKLSTGQTEDFLATCDELDQVADKIKDLTAFGREAATDKKFTAKEIAEFMDKLAALAAEVDDIPKHLV